jgi:hypothetical protein
MAFLFRAALVVGAIYMLSPVQPDGPSVRPQEIAAEAARLAASHAIQACATHPDTCARLAAGGAAITAAVKPGPASPPAAPPATRKEPTR